MLVTLSTFLPRSLEQPGHFVPYCASYTHMARLTRHPNDVETARGERLSPEKSFVKDEVSAMRGRSSGGNCIKIGLPGKSIHLYYLSISGEGRGGDLDPMPNEAMSSNSTSDPF